MKNNIIFKINNNYNKNNNNIIMKMNIKINQLLMKHLCIKQNNKKNNIIIKLKNMIIKYKNINYKLIN